MNDVRDPAVCAPDKVSGAVTQLLRSRLPIGAIVVIVAALLTGSAASAGAADDASSDRASLELLQAWARASVTPMVALAYVELPTASRPLAWRFLRMEARGDCVDLAAVASHVSAASDCGLDRRYASRTREEVAGILAAASRALAVAQSASALASIDAQRRALVLADRCGETSRTFAAPLLPEQQALVDQLAGLADVVLKKGLAVNPTSRGSAPVGRVWMRADGALVLDVVAERGTNRHGTAEFVYSLGDSEYPGVLVHIGGICPGRRGQVLAAWPTCER